MDKRVNDILNWEKARQLSTIELIASENFASDDVMAVSYTHLTLPTNREV